MTDETHPFFGWSSRGTLRDRLKARPHAPQSEPATFTLDYADGQTEYFEIEDLEKFTRIPDGEIVTGVMDNGEIIVGRIQPADTRTCAQRHDEVIAMLSRRVDRLEAEMRQLRETVQNWTGE